MLACTPHPGYGTVRIDDVAVNLATCARSRVAATRITRRAGNRSTIRIHGKVVFRTAKQSSVIVVGRSPDGTWVLFAVDPMSSASLAADGLQLQAVSVAGGKPRTIGPSLLGGGDLAWCGDTLVLTAGGDRIAAHDKWLAALGRRTGACAALPSRAGRSARSRAAVAAWSRRRRRTARRR